MKIIYVCYNIVNDFFKKINRILYLDLKQRANVHEKE